MARRIYLVGSSDPAIPTRLVLASTPSQAVAHVAKQLLDHGFYLSFGKYLLRNPELKTVFQSVPNDRFFLETDTIEETLEEVYSIASEYKGMTIEALQQQIAANYEKVFFKV